EHARRLLWRRREPAHELVERALDVEQHRVEVMAPAERDAPRLAVERRDAERVLEPERRVDGEDDRPPALPRRRDTDRRGRGRLADAAAADADDDLPLGDEVRERHAARPAASDSTAASSATPPGASGPS